MAALSTIPLLMLGVPPRLNRRGKEYVRQMQSAFASLKRTVAVNNGAEAPAVDANVVLIAGLFGTSALAGSAFAHYNRLLAFGSASGGGTGGGGKHHL